MTPKEFRTIRERLKLSTREMGLALGLHGDPGRTVRRYEAGTVEISGPVSVAMMSMREGFRPPWYPKAIRRSTLLFMAAASRVRHKEEARARYALNRAVKSGAITRPSHCEQCGQIEELNHRGQTNIHGHHDDYAKPLEVRWLCRKCHVAHHRALKDQKP